MNSTITKHALINATLTTLYIALVAKLMFYLQHNPGPGHPDNTVFIPIAMLLLFVFSAALTGSLVLGRPVMWYVDGKKKEAVKLLGLTLVFLCVITLAAVAKLWVVLAR